MGCSVKTGKLEDVCSGHRHYTELGKFISTIVYINHVGHLELVFYLFTLLLQLCLWIGLVYYSRVACERFRYLKTLGI